MAKGKHAVALFEVISANKDRQRSGPRVPAARAPWWRALGKMRSGRHTPEAPTPAPAPTAEELAADPTLKPLVSVSIPEQPSQEPSVSDTTETNEPTMRIAPADNDVQPVEALPADENESEAPRVRQAPVELKVDRAHEQVVLKMRFTSAIIIAFALVVIVALAYITGRSSGGSPQAGVHPTTEEIRAGEADPSVLDVGSNEIATTETPVESQVEPEVPTHLAETASARETRVQPTTGGRTIGLNYVIIQSYPEVADADRAAAFLESKGIDVTVERGLPFAPSRHCVVGLRGFPVPYSHLPEYQQYMQAIEKVNSQIPPRAGFGKFDPTGLRWTGETRN